MGEPFQQFETEWTEWGKICEPKAREYYGFNRDIDVAEVGLIYRDEGRMVAASPDGLAGDDGLIEIKCPSPEKHLLYLARGALPREYIGQVQGQLWVTGRKWVDFMSYYPDLPTLIVRVEPDEKYHDALG